MPLKLPTLVILDLDGTLVDSVPDIAVALDAALDDMGLPPVGEDNTRRWVGNGARMLVRRALDGPETDDAVPENPEVNALLNAFLAQYAQHLAGRTTIYPGVTEALDFFREQGCRMAVVTNKPEELAKGLLAALDLDGYFDLVLGGDSLQSKKPDPAPFKHAMNELGCKPARSLVIGDSVNDISPASALGIDSICVTYGYNQGRDPHSLGATLVLDTLADLPAHIEMAAHS